jgi:hypothetical protein
MNIPIPILQSKTGINMSSDGTYQTAFGRDLSGNLAIAYSKNKGTSWSIPTYPVGFVTSSFQRIQGVSMSQNGMYQAALFISFGAGSSFLINSITSKLIQSSDYGTTWAISTLPSSLVCVGLLSFSQNGQYQTIGTIGNLFIQNQISIITTPPQSVQ